MKKIAPLLFALTLAIAASAQSENKSPLYQTVAALDKKLFDAYNTCDLKTLGEMVSDAPDFYHDQTVADQSCKGHLGYRPLYAVESAFEDWKRDLPSDFEK